VPNIVATTKIKVKSHFLNFVIHKNFEIQYLFYRNKARAPLLVESFPMVLRTQLEDAQSKRFQRNKYKKQKSYLHGWTSVLRAIATVKRKRKVIFYNLRSKNN